jgi:hypothetical protein
VNVEPIPESWLRELSPIDRLAVEADLDPDVLRSYLEREGERRRTEVQLPELKRTTTE